MKPIKEYFKNKNSRVEYLYGYTVHINRELLLEIIKEIQIDTIKETVQACADNVKFKFEDNKDSLMHVIINKSSILEVAEKLIKGL